jgi:DNA-binding Xre family transcriptional regulator
MFKYNSIFVYCNVIVMERKLLNRIKVILAEKGKTNKWLSEQLGKDPAIVSKWVTNTSQPNVEMLIQIAKCLEVKVDDLLRTE